MALVRCFDRAVVDGWGSGGLGVRAVLDSAQLLVFPDVRVTQCAAVGGSHDGDTVVAGLRRPAG